MGQHPQYDMEAIFDFQVTALDTRHVAEVDGGLVDSISHEEIVSGGEALLKGGGSSSPDASIELISPGNLFLRSVKRDSTKAN